MVMATFTRSINHLQTASSLIPHRVEREKGAGRLQNKLLLPLSHQLSLSLSLTYCSPTLAFRKINTDKSDVVQSC